MYFSCELSVTYALSSCRVEGLSYQEPSLFSDCNSGCLCSRREWDPVCGENGITYVSPCLAGCTSSSGAGRNTVRPVLPPLTCPCFLLHSKVTVANKQSILLFFPLLGFWQLQVCGTGWYPIRQPDGHSRPMSNQRKLWQNLSILPGTFCPQFLHHLSWGNTWLYAARQVCQQLTCGWLWPRTHWFIAFHMFSEILIASIGFSVISEDILFLKTLRKKLEMRFSAFFYSFTLSTLPIYCLVVVSFDVQLYK